MWLLKHERKALLEKKKFTSDIYRDCMSRFAGTVNIITTDGEAGKRGVTVSAATSVSDNPPSILFCLNQDRVENSWFEKNGVFAMNTLCKSHEKLARAFAGEGHLDMPSRFNLGDWETIETGAPVLKGARMSLDCKIVDVQKIATHFVIIGEVLGYNLDALDSALVYLDRSYKEV